VAKLLVEDQKTVADHLGSLEEREYAKKLVLYDDATHKRKTYYVMGPKKTPLYQTSLNHEKTIVADDYEQLIKTIRESIREGGEWISKQEIKFDDLSGFRNIRTRIGIETDPQVNAEISATCAELLSTLYSEGLINDLRRRASDVVRRTIDFVYSQRIEDKNTIAYRNPYVEGGPLCPKITGGILQNLVCIEESNMLPDFHVPKDFKDKACAFIEANLRTYVDQVISKKFTLMQDPLTTIVVSLLGYIKAKGKNSVYDSSFVREFFIELLKYQQGGGFRPRISERTPPTIEHTAVVVFCLLDKDSMNLKTEEIKRIGLYESLKSARKFLAPKKGEKLLSSAHPVFPILRTHALLLLGVHPCNRLVIRPSLQSVLAQQRSGSWGDDVEQTHHVLAHLIWCYRIIKENIENPRIQWNRMKTFSEYITL